MIMDCIKALFKEKHVVSEIDNLYCELNEALALLERDFPVCIQNITQHLLHHVVDGIRNFGPLYSTWMFGFERLNGWVSRRALNKRHPESTIIETYLVYDFSQMMAAMGHINKRFLEGNMDLEHDHHQIKCKSFNLTQEMKTNIFQIYCEKNATLSALWTLYNHEKKRSRSCSFPRFDEWQPSGRSLTEAEKELTQPLTSSATSFNSKVYEDQKTGRTVTYATKKMATERSDSSVVKLKSDSEPVFGRILKIFDHQDFGRILTLCAVQVFDNIESDEVTGLWKYCSSTQSGVCTKIATLDTLSYPLAYAKDKDGMTWILN